MNQHHQPSKPASAAEISEALQILFSSMPLPRGADPKNAAVGYISALNGFTVEAITAGILRFLRGECSDVSPKFCPHPPELATIIRTTVAPSLIPRERRVEQYTPPALPGERDRMRLKMPMYQAAFGNGPRMDALAKANREGFGAMAVLAASWGVPVPTELFENDNETERQWQQAHNRALVEIERNPPPYMRSRRAGER